MPKLLSEKQSRANILGLAKRFKCEGDIKAIFEKYDRALTKCTNQHERDCIAAAGAAELHRYFYCRGNLVVNGQEILPAEPGYEDIGNSKIIKL